MPSRLICNDLIRYALCLLLSMVSDNFSRVNAFDDLTGAEIHQHSQLVVANREQLKNGPITSFRFQEFIKKASYPLADQAGSEASILRLRDLFRDLAPNNLATGIHIIRILRIHLGDTKFVLSKLLEAEIRFLSRFILLGADSLNQVPIGPGYQIAVNQLTSGFSGMVGRIDLSKGSATGTLMPIPVAGGAGHQWVVLTCAHIMDRFNLADNPAEAVSFTLHGIPPLSVRSIKLFKRNGRQFATSYNAPGGLPSSALNMIELGDLARSLPRYDSEGDVAICYLSDNAGFLGNTQAQLNLLYPIANFQHDQENERVSFFMPPPLNRAITFSFVNDLARTNALIAVVNGLPKNANFIIGYAGFNPSLIQVLSTARPGPGPIPLYPAFIDPGTVTAYDFFHDAPIYEGMSGGPIFHVTPGNPNVIHVYGVVQSAAFGALGANAAPSRCKGSFLQRALL